MRLVDLRGKKPPYTVVQMAKTMKSVAPGEEVTFLVGDKETIEEMYNWVKRTSHLVKEVESKGEHWVVRIVKRG